MRNKRNKNVLSAICMTRTLFFRPRFTNAILKDYEGKSAAEKNIIGKAHRNRTKAHQNHAKARKNRTKLDKPRQNRTKLDKARQNGIRGAALDLF